MAVGFPPVPVFPLGIDSNKTLYLVYNTSESVLASDNKAWSQEIEIVPIGREIWAENGFANINGELFYYDAVEKNSDGKIFKFKRCARNIGGKKTQFNKAGTIVRGFVIAEHHNQLVDAVIQVEKFVGENFSPDKITLDYRIRHLQTEPPCNDDHNCPEVIFEFEVTDTDDCLGTTVNYNLIINGNFTKFKIDFGDGNFTTTLQNGTHLYPPTSNIDPVVTVSNDKCQIVQTAITRTSLEEPPKDEIPEPFNIPIPVIPDFPTITIPDCQLPETTLTLPPIIQCNPQLSPIGSIPSVIVIEPPIQIPSIIIFDPIPSFSPISFGPAPSFSPIDFGPAPSFSPIDFGPAPSFSPIDFGDIPSFSPISFGPAPSFSPIDFGPAPSFNPIDFGPTPSFNPIDFGPPPSLKVSWAKPPKISAVVTLECDQNNVRARNARKKGKKGIMLDETFTEDEEGIEIETLDLGLPSKIEVVKPEFPDVNLVHNLPSSIEVTGVNIPPSITLELSEKSKTIDINASSVPKSIELNADNVPKSIALDASNVPKSIELKMQFPIPSVIKLDGPIEVKGIPDFIEVKDTIPREIIAKLQVPENLKIPVVYEGGPIPLDVSSLRDLLLKPNDNKET